MPGDPQNTILRAVKHSRIIRYESNISTGRVPNANGESTGPKSGDRKETAAAT